MEASIADQVSKFDMTPSAYKLPVTNVELRRMFTSTKKRARNSNMDHTLTEEEFMILFERSNGKCALSGLSFSGGKTDSMRVRPYFPSLDRINSEKGYTVDNVRFVCAAVNIALSDFGEDILRNIAFSIASKALSDRQGINKLWLDS